MSIDVGDPRRSHKDRDVSIFFEYPKYTLILPLPLQMPKGYPLKLDTIGDHIRKKRIDLGLLQRDVAEIIGVSKQTVGYWELGVAEPEIRHIPKIIEFLGYTPFECKSNNPIERLKHFKLINGLSYERLGALTGRDPEQLTDWLNGRHKPCKRNIEFFEKFLSAF